MNNDGINGTAADELKRGIERWERLQEEKKAIGADQKEVMDGLKGKGFCTKTVRRVIALRAMDPQERAEFEQTMDLYLAALGEV